MHRVGQANTEEYRSLREQLSGAAADLQMASEAYFRLAEEIDARRAAFRVESVYGQIVQARTSLNRARAELQAAQHNLDMIPAADRTPDHPELQRVIATTLNLWDELDKMAALLPRPAQIPASKPPAALAAPVPAK
jgi:multidrug resistance efflux pump